PAWTAGHGRARRYGRGVRNESGGGTTWSREGAPAQTWTSGGSEFYTVAHGPSPLRIARGPYPVQRPARPLAGRVVVGGRGGRSCRSSLGLWGWGLRFLPCR